MSANFYPYAVAKISIHMSMISAVHVMSGPSFSVNVPNAERVNLQHE